jgi:uncharacterized protein (DUF433 family)
MFFAMQQSDLVVIDPEILGGTPVFRGTRVPVQSLFDYLERDYTLSEFLECFPSVTREMACALLDRSESAMVASIS